jgi:hypothetical protein
MKIQQPEIRLRAVKHFEAAEAAPPKNKKGKSGQRTFL